MSVFSKLKCALGFSPSEDDEEEFNELQSSDSEEISEESHSSVDDRLRSSRGETSECGPIPEPDDSLPGKIFDEAIRLFNEWQPEFVSSCLNTEAQRAYLFKAMDEKVRQSLREAAEAARSHALAILESERRRASEEVNELKRRNEQLEEKRKEMKTAQLSADRQKRALSERVHDLESQVAQLEADKEQYQLENRSMLNKLRLASLDNTAITTAPESPAQASGVSAEDMISRSDHEAEVALLNDEVTRLKGENANLKEDVARLSDANSRLTETNTGLTESNTSLSKARDEAEERIKELEDIRKRRDVMVAQANSSARRMTDECESLRSEVTELNAKLHETEIRLQDSEERFKAARATLVEAEERVREATAPRRRRGRPGKDAAKVSAKDSGKSDFVSFVDYNATANDEPMQNVAVEDVQESPVMTELPLMAAENGLPDYGEAADMMARTATAETAPEASAASKRKVKPAISAIDDLLDGSDWMVSTPPPPVATPRQHKESQAEDDFGYKAPPRRQHIDNDAQMSLW